MNKTMFLFIYQTMITGGIECYIHDSIRNLYNSLCVDKKGVIGWIKYKNTQIDKHFENVMRNDIAYVANKVNINQIRRFISKNRITEIKVITFSVYDFYRAEFIKKHIKSCEVHTFYFVPHFTMACYYIEEYFEGHAAEKVNYIMQSAFANMLKNNNILFFSEQHQRKVQENYKINVIGRTDLFVPLTRVKKPFDKNRIKRIYYREKFNILLVSRIEFPHKAFMVGALKVFIRLKPKYPQIKLTIIGDGPQKKQLVDLINSCDQKIKQDIIMKGTVSPDKLSYYYDDANLLISLSGSLTRGARRGVLSLVARHYCYDCEVYGFLPECHDKVISDSPGYSLTPFIEEAINMSFEEYLERCQKTFNYYDSLNEQRPNFIDLKNKNQLISLTRKQMRLIRFTRSNIFHYLRVLKKYGFWGCVQKIIKRIKNVEQRSI